MKTKNLIILMIFGSYPLLADCLIKKDPPDFWPRFQRGIQTGELSSMDFHPRLQQITPQIFRGAVNRLKEIVGEPFEVSLSAHYELGASGEPLVCPGDESFSVRRLPGYERQMVLWIGLFGEKDLGRLFIHLVGGGDNRWQIGIFHGQKWTQNSLDAQAFWGRAQKSGPAQAYLESFLGEKLLQGGGRFYSFPLATEIKTWRERSAPYGKALEELRGILKGGLPLEAMEPLFASRGGIGLRFRVKKEESTVFLREHCTGELAQLQKTGWFSYKGLRCSYLLPGENPDREGQLGSLWVSAPDVSQRGFLGGFLRRFVERS
jgi:hypothetical protein